MPVRKIHDDIIYLSTDMWRAYPDEDGWHRRTETYPIPDDGTWRSTRTRVTTNNTAEARNHHKLHYKRASSGRIQAVALEVVVRHRDLFGPRHWRGVHIEIFADMPTAAPADEEYEIVEVRVDGEKEHEDTSESLAGTTKGT